MFNSFGEFFYFLVQRLILRLKFFYLVLENGILILKCSRCEKMLEKIEHSRLAPNGTKLTGAPHNERNESNE